MISFKRLGNKVLAKLTTRSRRVAGMYTRSYRPMEFKDIPWTPLSKPVSESRLALVTTAGVHHRHQPAFDMLDPEGDPAYRIIDAEHPDDLMITHDYYDHADADRDVNIVFPIQRALEFQGEGLIGELARYHYGFMGHIDGRHISTLINDTAPDVAVRLKKAGVDIALLTPG